MGCHYTDYNNFAIGVSFFSLWSAGLLCDKIAHDQVGPVWVVNIAVSLSAYLMYAVAYYHQQMRPCRCLLLMALFTTCAALGTSRVIGLFDNTGPNNTVICIALITTSVMNTCMPFAYAKLYAQQDEWVPITSV